MTNTAVLNVKAKAAQSAMRKLPRAELEGLLEAELAGRRRSTVIDWIKARMAALVVAERKAIPAAEARQA